MGHWLTRSGQIEPCVYQPGLPSRYEVIIPTKRLTDVEVDELHAAGASTSGVKLVYLDIGQALGGDDDLVARR